MAEAMARHPQVSRVFYPGLASFPGHRLAKEQMYGFGGMLSIEVATACSALNPSLIGQ